MSEPFTALYERTEGWWVATCPEIPGAITQGRTLDEARFMLRDAIKELGAARREKAERELTDAGSEVVREPLVL